MRSAVLGDKPTSLTEFASSSRGCRAPGTTITGLFIRPCTTDSCMRFLSSVRVFARPFAFRFGPPSSSHRPGSIGLYYDDPTRRRNVTDERTRLACEPFRGTSPPPEGGSLPDARIAKRGGRRGAGGLAPPRPLQLWRHREPGRVAYHGRRAGVPEHAALAWVATRAVPRRAVGRNLGRPNARPYRGPRGGDRPRAPSGPRAPVPRSPAPRSAP